MASKDISSAHSGEWWAADDVATKWMGTLTLDQQRGAVLQLTESTRVRGLHRHTREYDTIFGRTTEGKDVTLLRCFDRSVGGALDAPGSREIFANAAIVGFHALGRDPLVSGATAVFENATAWWGHSGLKVDGTKFPNALITYKKPPPLAVWSDGDTDISICSALASLPSSATVGGEFSIREELRVELRMKTRRPLSAVNATIQACGDLLSVACHSYCGTERLTLIDSVDDELQLGIFHAVPVRKSARNGRSQPPSLIFGLKDIKHRPVEAFCRWLVNFRDLIPIRALFFLALYGDNFLEGRFLSLAQAVESFHRRFQDGEYMPADEYKQKVMVPLIACIPFDVDSSHRQSLKNRIKYGAEYSLSKRLTLLFREHRETLEELIPNALELIRPIVERRNSLTHFPPPRADDPTTTKRTCCDITSSSAYSWSAAS